METLCFWNTTVSEKDRGVKIEEDSPQRRREGRVRYSL
jgi:hypothetical protein